MKPSIKITLWVSALLLFFLFLRQNLAYFSTPFYLEVLIVVEIVLVSLWRFDIIFFPLLMVVFLWAGSDPGLVAYSATSMRWVVLATGALAGAFLWMRRGQRPYTVLNLAAVLCVIAALGSAMMSNLPMVALLKVASLVLLFLYCSTGARLAVMGREARFMRGLLVACEFFVFISAMITFAGLSVLGNPNSLGAVLGVAVTPLLLWGFIIAQTRWERNRRAVFLLLCGFLLYSSLSRASLLAAIIVVVTLCLCLRRQQLLIRVVFLCVFFLSIAAVTRPSEFGELMTTTTSNVVYKGRPEDGLLSSRSGPWQQSFALIKQHPWLGSGFGTSDVGTVPASTSLNLRGGVSTGEGALREHGSSYLAMTEYMGLVGIVPFVFLLFLLLRMIVQMCLWMRRTNNACHPGIPMAMVLLAGLVHAIFEDWLFAVGYHLCVFFWTMAFVLKDLMPSSAEVSARGTSSIAARILHPIPASVVINR